jgi:hypothetical protein
LPAAGFVVRNLQLPQREMSRIPKLQQMIEAIALDRFGDPDVLSIHSLTVPTLDDHEV